MLITDSVLLFREKRKWQIALRRYILRQNKSSHYAPYFGLDIANFRKWMEIQFEGEMNWDNFSVIWQLDHIVPLAYFDFGQEEDLRLCWNFTNIRAEKLKKEGIKHPGRPDVVGANAYFRNLLNHTHLPICQKMLDKIENIEAAQIVNSGYLERFLHEKRGFLETISSFTEDEYLSLNQGNPVNQILLDREFLKRFE